MEQTEVETIERLSSSHSELRHLWSRHQGFEKELERLSGLRNPTADERREIARLKRAKLQGKDRIARILAEHG